MKTNKWILGIARVLFFSLFLGALGTCDLQNKPQNEPPEPFYRLMASGFGAVISTNAGYYYNLYLGSDGTTLSSDWPTPRTDEVGPWGSNGNYSEGGWWQKEIREHDVQIRETQDDYIAGLFLWAVNQGGAREIGRAHV
jgi:hypothetical protein